MHRWLLASAAIAGASVLAAACASGDTASSDEPVVDGTSGSTGGSGGTSTGTGGTTGKGGSTGTTGGNTGKGGTTSTGGMTGGGGDGTGGMGTTGGTTGKGGSGNAGGATGGTTGKGGTTGTGGGGTTGTGGGGSTGKGGNTGTGGGGATGTGGGGSTGTGGASGGACSSEELCNGLDDNCNGKIDEGDPEGGNPCTVQGKEGECAFGISACSKAGTVECKQINSPSDEICDGKDNNCDGVIDNNPTDVGGSCKTGKQGVCGQGTLVCKNGKVECEQNVLESAEQCNGFDDDCNGIIDDGFPGAGQPCTVPNQNPNTPCAQGQTACGSGQNTCVQVVQPESEVCDGKDNDCNGTIDDADVVNGKSCDTGLEGECKQGKTECVAGGLNCVPDTTPGQLVETCNNKDDDCDGVKDNVPDVNAECAQLNSSASKVINWLCTVGSCEVGGCATNYADCDGAPANGCEVNTSTDTANCGGCNVQCNATNGSPTCNAGQCGIVCSDGFGNCDGDPSNGCEQGLNTDPNNCGGCGVQCSSSNGTPTCSGGSCKTLCDTGFGDCDGNPNNGCETDLTKSTTHCGACGAGCSNTNGTPSCVASVCQITCNPGFSNCDNDPVNGCEIDLNTNATNCGGCGVKCSNANGTGNCVDGVCNTTCKTGYDDCDGDPFNGCETNLQNNNLNCGACNNPCVSNNGTTSCVTGACKVISCDAGFKDCNLQPADGCEVDTKNDETNCGTCGKTCSSVNGAPSCANGACAIACNFGFKDCYGGVADGCETNILNDKNNCGTCGNICPNSGGTPSCNGGVCGIACSGTLADCDNNLSCETNLANSVNNCGACGNVCQATGTTSTVCTNSTCVPTCNANSANCDGNGANGCETDLNNVNSCGSCNTVCSNANASAVACTNKQCVPTCNAGYGNCDGNGANGCEKALNTVDTCGSCTTTCTVTNGTPACSNQACVVQSCNAPFADCDGTYSNGCEANTQTSLAHCGGCNKPCNNPHGGEACNAGACTVTSCDSGWGNCNSLETDGCETDLTNNNSNCGACGNVCTANAGQGVLTASCGGTSCQVTSCAANKYDMNKTFGDGCECTGDTVGDNCGAALDLGTVATNTTKSAVGTLLGNLGTNNKDEDWYKVTFVVDSCSSTPNITLTVGGEPIRMRVYTACAGSSASGGQSCSAAETGTSSSKDVTQWEFTYSGSCGDQLAADPTPVNGPFSAATLAKTVWIQVFRTNDTATSCYPYTINITN